MSFGDAVRAFWINYGNFRGRARRSEYWFASLFLFVANLGALLADEILGLADPATGFGPVQAIWVLTIFLPSLSVLIRRLHDTNRSGWWVLILLVPFVGALVLLVFTVLDSNPSENKWGISPKQ